MKTHPNFAPLVVGTTAIFLAQLSGVFYPSQTYALKDSGNSDILSSAFGNLPANAESNAPNVSLGNKEFLVSQATSPIRFVPPADRSTRRSQGSGSRGCEQSLPGDLVTLLIPSKDYIAQTTSSHPTFFWHLSQGVSVPLKFTLVERGVAEPLFVKQINSPEAGMLKLELPKDKPGLTTGRTYSWSVTLECNARRPSANPYFYSWIERVPTTPALEQKLAVVSSRSKSFEQTPASESASRELASIYAEAGLWYDTLTTLSTARTENPSDRLVQEDFLALLKQVGLVEVAKQEQQSLAQR
jgi:hypothetical protein